MRPSEGLHLLPVHRRIFGSVASGGGTIGVLLGGVLVSTLGWPWIFLVNLPIGVVALALCWPLLDADRGQGAGTGGGPDTLGRSLNAVRAGGSVAVIGVLTGVAGNAPTLPILQKAVRVQGVNVGSRAMFEDMNRALSLNPSVRPIVDRDFRFEEAPDALRYLESGAHFGKIVMKF